LAYFFLAVFSASASEWYRSNPGGLALERMARLAALRQDYALEVTDLEIEDLPSSLKSMGIETNRIIGEILYHENKVILRRYKLYDVQNRLMAASQFADPGYSWIERYDTKGRLIEEYWSIDSSSWFRREFTLNKELIVASKTYDGSPGSEGTLLYTDTYRYDRSGFLRTIERILRKTPLLPEHPNGFPEMRYL